MAVVGVGRTIIFIRFVPRSVWVCGTAAIISENHSPPARHSIACSRIDGSHRIQRILGRHFNDAKEHLDLLAQKQPNNPDVYIARANYYSATNNTTAALADMQKALQLDPRRSESYLNLALLQLHGQQWDAAEGNFKKAVELNPKSTNALVSLGNFYQTRGRFPEAEQVFRRAIDAAADDPNPRLSLAALYMAENKPGPAEEFLRQSKKDFPNNSVGYRMLGDFYFANNQLDKATAEYAALYRDHSKDMQVKKN